MNTRWIATTLCAMLLLSGICHAETKEELKARFKKRHDALLALKLDGKIGETVKGHVEAVTTVDEKATKLMNAENADRDALYKILAEEEKTTVEVVARNSAKVKFKKMSGEEYFKAKDGKWRKKKDMLK